MPICMHGIARSRSQWLWTWSWILLFPFLFASFLFSFCTPPRPTHIPVVMTPGLWCIWYCYEVGYTCDLDTWPSFKSGFCAFSLYGFWFLFPCVRRSCTVRTLHWGKFGYSLDLSSNRLFLGIRYGSWVTRLETQFFLGFQRGWNCYRWGIASN